MSKAKSAYQIAVDQGFVGNQDEWLTTLIGERGRRGPQGFPGVSGARGNTGLVGPAGPAGACTVDSSGTYITVDTSGTDVAVSLKVGLPDTSGNILASDGSGNMYWTTDESFASNGPANSVQMKNGTTTDFIGYGNYIFNGQTFTIDSSNLKLDMSAIAIGYNAGLSTQKEYAVAIGNSAGETSQQDFAVAIGYAGR